MNVVNLLSISIIREKTRCLTGIVSSTYSKVQHNTNIITYSNFTLAVLNSIYNLKLCLLHKTKLRVYTYMT